MHNVTVVFCPYSRESPRLRGMKRTTSAVQQLFQIRKAAGIDHWSDHGFGDVKNPDEPRRAVTRSAG